MDFIHLKLIIFPGKYLQNKKWFNFLYFNRDLLQETFKIFYDESYKIFFTFEKKQWN